MPEGLEIILVSLSVLNQVLLDRVILVFLTVVMTAEQRIKAKAIEPVLHAVPVRAHLVVILANMVMRRDG